VALLEKCVFCDFKLRLDNRTVKLNQKGGFIRLYCDNCEIVFRINFSGKYDPKKSIIMSSAKGKFKSDYDLMRGFSTKTRVLKVKPEVHKNTSTWIINNSELEFRNKKEKTFEIFNSKDERGCKNGLEKDV